MQNLGRIDNLGLGMGLRMYPGQVIPPKYANLDGIEEFVDFRIGLVLLIIILYYFVKR